MRTKIQKRKFNSQDDESVNMDIHIDCSFSKDLVIKPGEKWYINLPKKKVFQSSNTLDDVVALKAEAENHLQNEIHFYKKYQDRRRDKDYLWIKKILHNGTLSDKISAHTILIQDSPVHNFNSIEALIRMVDAKGKRECLMVLDSLKELFITDLLIKNSNLDYFDKQPLTNLEMLSKGNTLLRKRILILWLFEDKLKNIYLKFLNNLKSVSHDVVDKTKLKAVNVMFNLLRSNSEQEQFLLEHLVNKIGDPLPKVGSNVCYLLGQLLDYHPHMKTVVVKEVEQLLFRPNNAERAKYYCLCFLNQIILSHGEFELANRLIINYFAQFKACTKKGEVNTKMMSALLSGVTRAYPFSKLKENILMEQLDDLYRLIHLVNFNISVQAMMLIFQVLDSKDSISDRFYCALYRKLLDPNIATCSRQAMFLNLVYQALKKDVSLIRIKTFVKRLLQVALYQAPNLQCGILLLVSELVKIHPNFLDTKEPNRFDNDSDSDEHYDDIPEDDENKIEVDSEKEDVKPIKDLLKNKPTNSNSWVHKQKRFHKKNNKFGYEADGRNPLHSGAEFCNIWELLYLKKSFHPSVSLFGHQICNSQVIKYSGDPLNDFTIMRFLDRFVYRNPKKPNEAFTSNKHQQIFGARKLKALSLQKLPINSKEYIQQNENKIPVDEQFIYKYLRKQMASKEKPKKTDSDIESVCSDDFQRLLDGIHPEDEGKDTIDFVKELNVHRQKKSSLEDNGSDSNETDLEGESDPDINFDDDEFNKAFADIDDFMDMKDFENFDIKNNFEGLTDNENELKPPKKKAKKTRELNGDLFASAEEFSTLIEDNAGSKIDNLTDEAFINKDNSGYKQIAWEIERNKYVQGIRKQKRNKKFFKGKKKNRL